MVWNVVETIINHLPNHDMVTIPKWVVYDCFPQMIWDTLW